MIGNILKERASKRVFYRNQEHGPRRGLFRVQPEGSLESLKTDVIDLYFLHNLGNPDRLDAEMMQTAEKLKKSGKIRFFVVSPHNMVATLEKAAEVGFVDAVFETERDYNNDALNRAIDKMHEANIGLMAMKTQGGAVSFSDGVDKFKAKGFNPYQAALKAVWADERIDGAVSAMKNIKQIKENAAAARNSAMGFEEQQMLREYAAETDHLYCRGCSKRCNDLAAPLQISETLRYRMTTKTTAIADAVANSLPNCRQRPSAWTGWILAQLKRPVRITYPSGS